MIIGIPKEIKDSEHRVGMTPSGVESLVSNGHKVYVESNSGLSSSFTDQEYSEAGAKICLNVKEMYEADIILKVEPPSLQELDYFKHNQCLISALQLKTQKAEYFKKLMDKKVTAVAFDYIKDEAQVFPFVRSTSKIFTKYCINYKFLIYELVYCSSIFRI